MYLERITYRPNMDALSDREKRYVQRHYDYTSTEVIVHGNAVPWDVIDSVEVVVAARAAGPSGWLVRRLVGSDRYHVGLYFGRQELVLPNVSLALAKYIVEVLAYHAPYPVQYTGPDDLVPLREDA
jgi:hypothetical protein